MNISTADLQAFLALVHEKSFTRAAARCHLSQSAFSSKIRALEEGLGARLFDRTTRSVELTAEGRLFEESAQRLYSEFSEIVDNFRDHAARRKGRVVVAALPSIASGWLPGVVMRFRSKYPGIELSVIDALSDICVALLRSGQADLAITSTSISEDDLEARLLGADQFFLVCRKGHPLLSRKEIGAEDLAAYPFVHVARSSSVRQHIETALHPIKMRTAMEMHYLATVASMVEVGVGITVVPGLTLHQFRRPSLTKRALSIPGLERPIYIMRRRGRTLSIAAKAVYEQIFEDRYSFDGLVTTASATKRKN